MEEVKKKRGRPTQNGSRHNRIQSRLSDIEYEIVSNASKSSGKSISEMVRIGLLKYAASVSINDLDSYEEENDELL